jgi:GNAT superfamily N-acetyltransferase
MKIRPAKIEDALPVAQVIVDVFSGTYHGIVPDEVLQQRKHTYDESAHRWREVIEAIEQGRSPLSCVYVAENAEGEVIGMSYACPSKDEARPEHVGELDMLYIRENYQRQGVGSALVQVTAAHMARVGMTTLHICTPTAHTQGRRFYDKLGGKIVGTREDHDNGEVIPLVVYEWANIQTLVNLGAKNE